MRRAAGHVDRPRSRRPSSRPGRTVAWPSVGSPGVRVRCRRAAPGRAVDRRSVGQRSAVDRSSSGWLGAWFGVRVGSVARPLGVKPRGYERRGAPPARTGCGCREVDATLAGQVPDPEDPTDVVLAIETDVGRRPRRAEQTLVLVDPQGARMNADDARGHADHIDGPLGIALGRGEDANGSAPGGVGGVGAGRLDDGLAGRASEDWPSMVGLMRICRGLTASAREGESKDAVLEGGGRLVGPRGRSAGSPSGSSSRAGSP